MKDTIMENYVEDFLSAEDANMVAQNNNTEIVTRILTNLRKEIDMQIAKGNQRALLSFTWDEDYSDHIRGVVLEALKELGYEIKQLEAEENELRSYYEVSWRMV